VTSCELLPKRIIDNFCTKYTYVGVYEQEVIDSIPAHKLDVIDLNDATYLKDCLNVDILEW
jgi:hypothetical protein